ncbi:MAG TPA: ATP-binding protein [Acidimicrobiales bacterium]|nr:ATP-binding protein [Acidimicrobiales bacterium]
MMDRFEKGLGRLHPHVEAGFECDARSVGAARAFVDATLEAWGLDDSDQVAALLTSEIATNAVVHARTAYRVAVDYRAPEVLVQVMDESPGLPVRRDPDPYEPTGRGLLLLDSYAARWGCRQQARGKSVWFVLRRPAVVADRPAVRRTARSPA